MDGNRTGSDPEPLIILSTLADGADIAEILRSKESRNQGKANAQKFPNS